MAEKPAPSLAQRKQDAGLPVRATTSEIAAMGQVTFLSAEESEARNPESGEMSPGYIVIVQDSDGRKFQAFVGGVVLQRDIAAMLENDGFPFTATLTRDGTGKGHPWTFGE